MANKKISQYTDGVALQDADMLVIARGSANYKLTGAAMRDAVLGRIVDAETPVGTINGTDGTDGNAVFTLAHTPFPEDSIQGIKTEGPASTILDPTRYDRAPTVFDNTSRGYASNNVWQANGQVWTLAAAPSATSAMWEPYDVGQGSAADVVGVANCHSIVGICQMLEGFTGPCIDINVVLATVNTTKTIDILADGSLDSNELAKWIHARDSGSDVKIIKFYDQSGNSRHYVPNSGVIGMYVVWDDQCQRWAYTGEVSPGATGSYRANPYMKTTTGDVTSTNHAIIVYGRGSNTQNAGNTCVGAVGTYASPGGTGCVGFSTNSRGAMLLARQNGTGVYAETNTAVNGLSAAIESSPSVLGQVVRPTTVVNFVNEKVTTTTVSYGSFTCTGAWMGTHSIGAGHTGNSLNMWGLEWGRVVLSVAPTDAQLATIRRAGYKKFNIQPQVLDQVAIVGDSRAVGMGAYKQRHLATLLGGYTRYKSRTLNFGQGSQTAEDSLIDATGGTKAAALKYRAGVRNIAYVLLGVNDFAIDLVSVDTAFTRVLACISSLKTAGWHVVLIAELTSTVSTGSANTNLPLLRTRFLTEETGADEVLDVTTGTDLDNPASLAYLDALHPAAAGNGILASLILDSHDAYLSQETDEVGSGPLIEGIHFNLSGATITYTSGNIPVAGQTHRFSYRYSL